MPMRGYGPMQGYGALHLKRAMLNSEVLNDGEQN